jgi:hypothetical protein
MLFRTKDSAGSAEPADDYGHVVGLFGGTGPSFGGGHEQLSDNSGRGDFHAQVETLLTLSPTA